MEHLLLEVAAAPLRLIAAKNEKSRSELGRFLVKQVREGTRVKAPGRPRHPLARAPWPCAETQGTGKRRLVTLARSPGLARGGGVLAPLRSQEGAFCYSRGESLAFPSPPTYPLAAP